MSLKGVFDKLEAQVDDLTKLTVRTFTGDVKAALKAAPQGAGNGKKKSQLDWAALQEAAKADGEIKLVALTEIKLDGDIDQFFADGLTDSFRDMHFDAVEAGRQTREGLMALATGAVQKII